MQLIQNYKDLYEFILALECQDESAANEEQIKLAYWYTRSDGCTGVLDIFKKACIIHDFHYRTHHDLTGRVINRAEADRRFRKRMQSMSKPQLDWLPLPVRKNTVVAAICHYLGCSSPIAWWRWAAVRCLGGRFWETKTHCRI